MSSKPNNPAKDFLDHPLDKLPGAMNFDHNGVVVEKADQIAFAYTPTSTYRNLQNYLLIEESTVITSDLFFEAKEAKNEAAAHRIDFLRSIPLPIEKYAPQAAHNPEEVETIIREWNELQAQIDQRRVIPKFFRALEKKATGKNLTPIDHHDLNNGMRMIQDIYDDKVIFTTEIFPGAKDLQSGIRAGAEETQLHAEIHNLPLKALTRLPESQAELEKQIHDAILNDRTFLSQLKQFTEDAGALISALGSMKAR